MTSALIQVAAGLRCGGRVALQGSPARHLGTDQGALCHVEMQQARRRRPPSEAGVGAHEVAGKIGAFHPLEIHCQESDVGKLVSEA